MSADLQHKRILVTRQESKARAFAEQINLRGGEAVVTPLIQIACTYADPIAPEQIRVYEWLLFTSANGVKCFFNRLGEVRLDQVKIAVVGSKTNEALQAYGYAADFIPSVYNAKTMAPEFIHQMHPQGPVLIVHGRLSGTVLQEAFVQKNIRFDCMEVYDTVTYVDVQAKLQESLEESIDWITFTSPSTVDAFMELVDAASESYSTPVFAIGTTTGKRARACGFTHVFVPEVFTIEGMLDCMHQYVRRERKNEYNDEHTF